MYSILVAWKGGPKWDSTAPSIMNSEKSKSAIEHLIETGGTTIDEAIEAYEYFKKMPIKVVQEYSTDESINWITRLDIISDNLEKANFVKEELLKYYDDKQNKLKNNPIGYSIEIKVDLLVNRVHGDS